MQKYSTRTVKPNMVESIKAFRVGIELQFLSRRQKYWGANLCGAGLERKWYERKRGRKPKQHVRKLRPKMETLGGKGGKCRAIHHRRSSHLLFRRLFTHQNPQSSIISTAHQTSSLQSNFFETWGYLLLKGNQTHVSGTEEKPNDVSFHAQPLALCVLETQISS